MRIRCTSSEEILVIPKLTFTLYLDRIQGMTDQQKEVVSLSGREGPSVGGHE